MSSLPIPKIYSCGSDVIIIKSDTSPFSIMATFSATHLHDSDVTTSVSNLP